MSLLLGGGCSGSAGYSARPGGAAQGPPGTAAVDIADHLPPAGSELETGSPGPGSEAQGGQVPTPKDRGVNTEADSQVVAHGEDPTGNPWEMTLYKRDGVTCQRLSLTTVDGPARFKGSVGGCHYQLPLDAAEARNGVVRAVWGPVAMCVARVAVRAETGERWTSDTYLAQDWSRSTWIVFVPAAAILDEIVAYGPNDEVVARRSAPQG